ncbi:hypothetical protein M3Y98_00495700 [Aphelenchoides besseyi]|nr:hypothetical protein M3Y98_00495700 [Aphelenchoides besseyi]KAI6207716.1 hypothetical protein M3Y96_00038300 [Aphelenchoides besseyi]
MNFLLDRLLNSTREVTTEEHHDAKTAQIRETRRKNRRISTKLEFVCSRSEFYNTAGDKFHELIVSNSCSSSCYQIILNTLVDFFTPADSNGSKVDIEKIEKGVSHFLQYSYLRDLEVSFENPDLSWTTNEEIDVAIREREVYCMFRFYLLKYDLLPVLEFDLSDALKFVYLRGGSERLKNFMDETLCDEFFIDFPFYIASIYQDMGMMCPSDLNYFSPYLAENGEEFFEEDSVSAKLREFFDSVNADEEDAQKDGTKKLELLQKPATLTKSTPTRTPIKKKKANCVLATPQKSTCQVMTEVVDKITIQRTPNNNLKRGETRVSIQLNALLEASDNLGELINCRSNSTNRPVEKRKIGAQEESVSQSAWKRPRVSGTRRSRLNLAFSSTNVP